MSGEDVLRGLPRPAAGFGFAAAAAGADLAGHGPVFGDDRGCLLTLEHRLGDFRCISQVTHSCFQNRHASACETFLRPRRPNAFWPAGSQ